MSTYNDNEAYTMANAIPEDEAIAHPLGSNDDPPGSNTAYAPRAKHRLSHRSKMYDIDGDGVLDETELALRDMDPSGKGHISNEKVYGMMKEQMHTQKQLFQVKRIMFVLLAIVVILAISNLGTSFAAASLAKDTSTTSEAELTDKKTNEKLSTQNTVDTFSIERTIEITEEGTRRLCNPEDDCAGETFLTLEEGLCAKVIRQCKRGNNINLEREWPNGDTSYVNVCPIKSGTLGRDNYHRSTLVNSEGMELFIEPLPGGHCEVRGRAVFQVEGGYCYEDNDCNVRGGFECTEDFAFIDACKIGCKDLQRIKGVGPTETAMYFNACLADCEMSTCQRSADFDGDGLSDIEELEVYLTDPDVPDTDGDGLSDGEEELVHDTNPLQFDTDGGGVSDGKEVLVDLTDPKNGGDDLTLAPPVPVVGCRRYARTACINRPECEWDALDKVCVSEVVLAPPAPPTSGSNGCAGYDRVGCINRNACAWERNGSRGVCVESLPTYAPISIDQLAPKVPMIPTYSPSSTSMPTTAPSVGCDLNRVQCIKRVECTWNGSCAPVPRTPRPTNAPTSSVAPSASSMPSVPSSAKPSISSSPTADCGEKTARFHCNMVDGCIWIKNPQPKCVRE